MDLGIRNRGLIDNLFRCALPFWDADAADAAVHPAKYAVIANYVKLELRYMDAGEQGPKARSGPRGTPGYQ
jgi:hypothetical protein